MFKEFVDAKALVTRLEELLKQAEKLLKPVELYVFFGEYIVFDSN